MESSKPSRAEIETLCVLYALGTRERTVRELIARLGVRTERISIVAGALAPLVASGWIAQDGEVLRRTDAGRDHLDASLQRFGVADAGSGAD